MCFIMKETVETELALYKERLQLWNIDKEWIEERISCQPVFPAVEKRSLPS